MKAGLDGWLTAEQAADQLGLSRRRIAQLYRTVLVSRFIDNVVMISRSSLEEYQRRNDGWMTTKQVAHLLGISNRIVHYLVRIGKIFPKVVHKRYFLFRKEEVAKYKMERDNAHGRDGNSVPLRKPGLSRRGNRRALPV